MTDTSPRICDIRYPTPGSRDAIECERLRIGGARLEAAIAAQGAEPLFDAAEVAELERQRLVNLCRDGIAKQHETAQRFVADILKLVSVPGATVAEVADVAAEAVKVISLVFVQSLVDVTLESQSGA